MTSTRYSAPTAGATTARRSAPSSRSCSRRPRPPRPLPATRPRPLSIQIQVPIPLGIDFPPVGISWPIQRPLPLRQAQARARRRVRDFQLRTEGVPPVQEGWQVPLWFRLQVQALVLARFPCPRTLAFTTSASPCSPQHFARRSSVRGLKTFRLNLQFFFKKQKTKNSAGCEW